MRRATQPLASVSPLVPQRCCCEPAPIRDGDTCAKCGRRLAPPRDQRIAERDRPDLQLGKAA